MTKKDVKQSWGERQQRTFEELKENFMTEPVLVISDLNKEIRVEADILDFTTNGVLSIKYEDKKWRPVIYISKSLNKAEKNYQIHNKEILAIIKCLETWRYFLEGIKDQFEIQMDQKLGVLYENSEVKLKTGQIGFIFVKILFCFKVLRNDKWQIEDNLVLKEGKMYISKDKELRLKII